MRQTSTGYLRNDGRAPDALREILFTTGTSPHAEGSCEVSFGRTKVLVTASVLQEVPRWLENSNQGWITAEYGMLPRATHTRTPREASAGKQGGRTLEIQRLIGRALRAAVSLAALAKITVRIDCDVLVADGGTRVAAISGAWVALSQAIRWATAQGLTSGSLAVEPVGAVSVGIVDGRPLLDLSYEEDSKAEFDLNLVFNGKEDLIEVQGTAEKKPVSRLQLTQLIELELSGAQEVIRLQQQAINSLASQ